MASKSQHSSLTPEQRQTLRWQVDPLSWVRDMFGDNLKREFRSYTGRDPLTETGLTVQQEQAFREMGKIIRAKLLLHQGAELTEEEQEYAGKIGISIMSGTGTGKDFFAALSEMYFLAAFPYARVAATANSAKQLRNVLWATAAKVMSLSKKVNPDDPNSETLLEMLFEWQSERISIRDKKKSAHWFAEASTISAKATESEQGVALGGRHAKYMLLIADEASGIPNGVFRPLEGTLTGAVNLLLVIFNPTRSTGFAIESQKDSRFIALRWNSEESEIVTESHIASFAKYGKDSNPYRIRILGLPPLSDSNTLIPWDWIEDARERELEPSDNDLLVKAADFGAGGDKSVLFTRRGGVWYGMKRSNTKDSAELEDWVYVDMVNSEADLFMGDCIGIGWAVMGNLRRRLGGHKVRSVDSRTKAREEHRFFNNRASMYWSLREAFEKKEVSLTRLSELDYTELSNQLGAITYSDDTGRIKIVSKSVIKEEIGHSNDESDAAAISYALPLSATQKPRKSFMDAYREGAYEGNARKTSWMAV